MSLVDLQEVKDFLGLSGSSDDTRLQANLDYVLGMVKSQLGDLSRGSKTIVFENDSIQSTNKLGLKHINVQQITAINGTNITALVNGVDYLINLADSTVIIPTLGDYTSNDFGVFALDYIAGWEASEVPKDFVGIVSGMVGVLYSQDLGRNVIEEQTGPHKTSFEGSKSTTGEDPLLPFKKRLRKYIPNHLKIW